MTTDRDLLLNFKSMNETNKKLIKPLKISDLAVQPEIHVLHHM